jgi:hypothetical protein
MNIRKYRFLPAAMPTNADISPSFLEEFGRAMKAKESVGEYFWTQGRGNQNASKDAVKTKPDNISIRSQDRGGKITFDKATAGATNTNQHTVWNDDFWWPQMRTNEDVSRW